MSFDEILDLTADVFSFYNIYKSVCFSVEYDTMPTLKKLLE